METPDLRMITVAIHTAERALALKSLLENAGVKASLQNVNLSQPVVSPGVRVRIQESDLPLALRVIENQIPYANPDTNGEAAKGGLTILVPTDYSDHSNHALPVAFEMAHQIGAKIVLLHSFLSPRAIPTLQLSDALEFDVDPVAQAETAASVENIAKSAMESLRRNILADIRSGKLPQVKFTTIVTEGVPEESIEQAVKDLAPWCLVMGTRCARQKENEMLGSVSAEVLDTCRVQAITIPETSSLSSPTQIHNVTLLSNFDQEDFLALDAIHRLLPEGQKINVTIVSLPSNRYYPDFSKSTQRLVSQAFRDYCVTHYPDWLFEFVAPDNADNLKNLECQAMGRNTDMMVVPNRKKNILARLFNPGLAHRILFSSDMPMMVVPV